MPTISRSTRLLLTALVLFTLTFPAAKPVAAASPEPPLTTLGGTIGPRLLIGRYLYVGLPNRIVVLDAQAPNQLPQVAVIMTSGAISRFQLVAGRLYVGTPHGWVVLDVSAPAAPRQLGFLPRIVGNPDSWSVFLPGQLAAVLISQPDGSSFTITILDVSNPSQPVVRSSDSKPRIDALIGGDETPTLVLNTGDALVYDLTDPTRLALRATLPKVRAGVIRGRYLYGSTLEGTWKLVVYDLQTFTRTSVVNLDSSEFDVAAWYQSNGTLKVQLGDGMKGGAVYFRWFDLTNPAYPRLVNAQYPLLVAAGLSSIIDATVVGGIARVIGQALDTNAFRAVTLDVRQPDNPRRLSTLALDDDFSGSLSCDTARCLVFGTRYENYHLTVQRWADLTDPNRPRLAPTAFSTGGLYTTAVTAGPLVYALHDTTVEIRRRADLGLVGQYTLTGELLTNGYEPIALTVRNNLAFVIAQPRTQMGLTRDALVILDVANAAAPRLLSWMQLFPLVGERDDLKLLELVGKTLVVTRTGWGTQLVNVTDPAKPSARLLYENRAVAQRAAVAGTILFVLQTYFDDQPSTIALETINLSDPQNIPAPVTVLRSSSELPLTGLVGAAGDTVYASAGREIAAISRSGAVLGRWAAPGDDRFFILGQHGSDILVAVGCTLTRLSVRGGQAPQPTGSLMIPASSCVPSRAFWAGWAVGTDSVQTTSSGTLVSLRLPPDGGLLLTGLEPVASNVMLLTADAPALRIAERALYSSNLPTSVTSAITPDGGSINDGRVRAEFGAGAFRAETPLTLRFGERTLPSAPGGLTFTGLVFNLSAPVWPSQPYTLTLRYTPPEAAGVFSNTLELRRWDGSAWVREPGTADPLARTLTVRPSALGWFALFGTGRRTFIPLLAAAR